MGPVRAHGPQPLRAAVGHRRRPDLYGIAGLPRDGAGRPQAAQGKDPRDRTIARGALPLPPGCGVTSPSTRSAWLWVEQLAARANSTGLAQKLAYPGGSEMIRGVAIALLWLTLPHGAYAQSAETGAPLDDTQKLGQKL